MGSQRRCFIVCWPLVRCPEGEVYLAPYEVYRRDCDPFATSIALGLHAIVSENIHFVRKNEESWWWNFFVISFN